MERIESFQELERTFNLGIRVLKIGVVSQDYEFKKIFNRQSLMSGDFIVIGPKVMINMHAVSTEIRDNPTLQMMSDNSNSHDLEAYRAHYFANTSVSRRDVHQVGYLLNLSDDRIGWYQTYNSVNERLGGYEGELSRINNRFDNLPMNHISSFLTGRDSTILMDSFGRRSDKNSDNTKKRKLNGGKKRKTRRVRKSRKSKKSRKYKN